MLITLPLDNYTHLANTSREDKEEENEASTHLSNKHFCFFCLVCVKETCNENWNNNVTHTTNFTIVKVTNYD